MHTRWFFCALVTLAAIAGGCDSPDELVGQLQDVLREHATPEQKTGTLRALQTARTAREVAEQAAAPVEPACALAFAEGRSFTYSFTLELSRRSAAGVEKRWSEARTLRRDVDGDLALEMSADAATEVGVGVQRSPQWLMVGDESFVSVDGRAFYRRAPGPVERERIIEAGSATLQTLLDAVPAGWRQVDADDGGSGGNRVRFEVGGERLVCGPGGLSELTSSQIGWLRRFDTRATPLSGTLQASDGSGRTLEVRWQLEDGATLDASFHDELSDSSKPVEAPDEESIVAVGRDRSLQKVEEMLSRMAKAGLVQTSGLVDKKDRATDTDSKDTTP